MFFVLLFGGKGILVVVIISLVGFVLLFVDIFLYIYIFC